MSALFQYYNLLMFDAGGGEMRIIGEDASVASFVTNPAVAGLDAAEVVAYNAKLAGVVRLVCTYTSLSQLPPGSGFTALRYLDITGCTAVTQVPATYSTTLTTLKLASTKVSSIPTTLTNIVYLDITNCKRISSVAIASLQTLVMSQSSVTEITKASELIRLYALSTRLAEIPSDATSLVLVLWSSSVTGGTLSISSACTSLISILTTGPVGSITSANGLLTPITA